MVPGIYKAEYWITPKGWSVIDVEAAAALKITFITTLMVIFM